MKRANEKNTRKLWLKKEKGDPLPFGRPHKRIVPALGDPTTTSNYLLFVTPHTKDFEKHRNIITIHYKLTTISKTQFDMQNEMNDFEGDYSFEKSLYRYLNILDNESALAERRVLVFGNQNHYSGYITRSEQKGTVVSLTVEVKKVNPLADRTISAPSEFGLVEYSNKYDFGFNINKEKIAYDNRLIYQ